MDYYDLDLWIEGGSDPGYRLRASARPLSDRDQTGSLDLDPSAPEYDELLERLEEYDTDPPYLRISGQGLSRLLFSGDVDKLLQRCYGAASRRPPAGVRIRLHIDPPELARLPWELLYFDDEDAPFARLSRFPLVRFVDLGRPILDLRAEPPIRILLAVPGPIEGYADLETEKEKADIHEAMRGLGSLVTIDTVDPPVTEERISDALSMHDYQCVHFIGHGEFEDDAGRIVLDDGEGMPDLVDEERFATLFLGPSPVNLVVLNSCYGAQVSSVRPLAGMGQQLVNRGVPAVVAMQFPIRDDAACRFTREFYRHLFKSKNAGHVDIAVSHARNRLGSLFSDTRDMVTPVLYLHSEDGLLFYPKEGLLRPSGEVMTSAVRAHERNAEILAKSEDPGDRKAEQQELESGRRLRDMIRTRRKVLIPAAILGVVAFFAAWVGLFDLLAIDTKFQAHAIWLGDVVSGKELDPRIALVAVDAESQDPSGLGALGKSWREHHVTLVTNLSKAGARVIVFDFWFETESEFDDDLAAAFRTARDGGTQIVLGYRNLREGTPQISGPLAAGATGSGCVAMGNKLGYAHHVPVAIGKADDATFPSLSLAALSAYRYRKPIDRLAISHRRISFPGSDPLKPAEVSLSEVSRAAAASRAAAVIQAGDRVAYIPLSLSPFENFTDPARRHSYRAVHAGEFGPEAFRDRIVVVGLEEERDELIVPRGFRVEERPGYWLHADIIADLIAGSTIRTLGGFSRFAIMIGVCLLGAALAFRVRYETRRFRAILASGVVVLLLMGAMGLLTASRVLVDVHYFVVAYLVVGLLTRKVVERCAISMTKPASPAGR